MTGQFEDDEAEAIIEAIQDLAPYLYSKQFEVLNSGTTNSLGLRRAYANASDDLIEVVEKYSRIFRSAARYDYLWKLHNVVHVSIENSPEPSFSHWLDVQHATGMLMLSGAEVEEWSDEKGVYRDRYVRHKLAESNVGNRFPELRILWALLLNQLRDISVTEQPRLLEHYQQLSNTDKESFIDRTFEIIVDGINKSEYSTVVRPTLQMISEFCSVPVDPATCEVFASQLQEILPMLQQYVHQNNTSASDDFAFLNEILTVDEQALTVTFDGNYSAFNVKQNYTDKNALDDKIANTLTLQPSLRNNN